MPEQSGKGLSTWAMLQDCGLYLLSHPFQRCSPWALVKLASTYPNEHLLDLITAAQPCMTVHSSKTASP